MLLLNSMLSLLYTFPKNLKFPMEDLSFSQDPTQKYFFGPLRLLCSNCAYVGLCKHRSLLPFPNSLKLNLS